MDIYEINGSKVLVAYVVVVEGELLDRWQLRERLRLMLPDYMLPTYYVELDEFPLTPNGKVDKKTLRLCDVVNKSEDTKKVHSEISETQKRVTHVLSKILAVDSKSIGLHDNFFDLGTHSLQLIKFQRALLEEFGSEIRMITLFEYSNVLTLSEYLENGEIINNENQEDNIIDSINDVLDFMND